MATEGLLWGGMIHNAGKDDDLHVGKHDEQNRSIDALKVNILNLDSVQSIIFTKIESSTSQGQTHIVCRVNIGADGNLMPFFKYLKIYLRGAACHKKQYCGITNIK